SENHQRGKPRGEVLRTSGFPGKHPRGSEYLTPGLERHFFPFNGEGLPAAKNSPRQRQPQGGRPAKVTAKVGRMLSPRQVADGQQDFAGPPRFFRFTDSGLDFREGIGSQDRSDEDARAHEGEYLPEEL